MYLQPFMIPKRISLILLLAMGLSLPTTGMVTDSLRKVISTLKGEDKARAYVDLYMALYNAGEIDSALLCLDDLIVLRQQQDSIEKEGNARWSRIAILNNAARFEQLRHLEPFLPDVATKVFCTSRYGKGADLPS